MRWTLGEIFLECGKLKLKLIFLRGNFLSALPSVFTALNVNFESVCRESQRQDILSHSFEESCSERLVIRAIIVFLGYYPTTSCGKWFEIKLAYYPVHSVKPEQSSMSESLESRTQIQDGGLALASLMIIWAFPLAHFTSANSLINRQLKRYNY